MIELAQPDRASSQRPALPLRLATAVSLRPPDPPSHFPGPFHALLCPRIPSSLCLAVLCRSPTMIYSLDSPIYRSFLTGRGSKTTEFGGVKVR